ncbi:hypothetical protein HDU84_007664 [Entophlyctis sp. JEL0112]|nr:hypothetical protein HDU84_007664 [Entophlyctis sp. JEL0112]
MILTGNGTGFIYQTQLILPYESYNATVVYSFTIDQFPRLNVHYDKLVSNQNETFIDLIVEIGLLSVVEFNDTQNASFSSSSISLANQTSWSPVELTSAVDCSEGENITQQIAKTIFTDGNFTLHLNALASQPIPGVQILKFQILYGGYPYSLNDSQLGFQVAESASGSVSGPDIDGVASETPRHENASSSTQSSSSPHSGLKGVSSLFQIAPLDLVHSEFSGEVHNSSKCPTHIKRDSEGEEQKKNVASFVSSVFAARTTTRAAEKAASAGQAQTSPGAGETATQTESLSQASVSFSAESPSEYTATSMSTATASQVSSAQSSSQQNGSGGPTASPSKVSSQIQGSRGAAVHVCWSGFVALSFSTGSPRPRLTLYSRKYCGLCDEARDQVLSLKPSYQFDFEVLDIDSAENKEWKELYNYEMPTYKQSGGTQTFATAESSFGTKSGYVPHFPAQNRFGRFSRRILLLLVFAVCAFGLHIGLLCFLPDKTTLFTNDNRQDLSSAHQQISSFARATQPSTRIKSDIPKIPGRYIPPTKPFVSGPLSILNLVTSDAAALSRPRNVSKYDKLSGFGDTQESFASETIRHNFDAIRDRLASYDTGRFLSLPFSDFELNQTVSEKFTKDSKTVFAQGRLRVDVKYFRECGKDRKRDFRFADKAACPLHDTPQRGRHGKPVRHKTRHNAKEVHGSLVGALKAWSRFAEEKDIDWWISHGELLGWFWNGQLLPWDNDLDIQVSMRGLLRLASHNQTKIDGRYLVDVGTSIFMRTKQAQNVIDARIVDTTTGYFIDVTGLAKLVSKANDTTQYNAVHCKTPHKYSFDDIVPLAETVLEGIRVWRPRKTLKLLKEEYGEKALFSAEYSEKDKPEKKWKFDLKQIKWV